MEWKEFIVANQDCDTTVMLLKNSTAWPAEGRDLAVSTIEGRRKIRSKLPAWYDHPELVYPTRLCCEQCSSQATASLKANIASDILASRHLSSKRIADLTGGLGVDAAAFAALPSAKVLHNEMDRALSDCVVRNFRSLGIANAEFRCSELLSGGVAGILGDFRPDLIFVDPARRDAAGHKVFRLEECTPNLLSTNPDTGETLCGELLENAEDLLIKLSPMADIQQVTGQLGDQVRHVWAVGSAGECKELLIHMHRGWSGGYGITAVNADRPLCSIQFSRADESSSVPHIMHAIPEPQGYLYEPGPALMKAGCYNLLSARYGMQKIGRMTHMYLTSCRDETLEGLGKYFSINEVHEFSSATVKEMAKRGLSAEVTARNVPVRSDEIRRRLKLKPSDTGHIFVLGSDAVGRLLLVTSTLPLQA